MKELKIINIFLLCLFANGCSSPTETQSEQSPPQERVESTIVVQEQSSSPESSKTHSDTISNTDPQVDHSSSENDFLDDVYQQVVNDSIREYEITKKHGDLADICAHSGLVAAAQLQAQNESGYKEWKRIEKIDCENFENEFMSEYQDY